MRKFLFKIVMLAGITVALTACYPGGAEYTSDTDIVLTNYNEDYNFNEVQTYYLADSINYVVEEGTTPDRSLESYILSELERNFDNLGWTRTVDSLSSEPDVAVLVSVIKVQNYNIYSYPWYGGWGWGWYWKSTGETTYWGYPGYGWGYPWYGGGTYVTSYEVGTVFWDLFRPDNVDEENEIIYDDWRGAVNGVLGTSTSSTKNRITNGIDQAFRQSAYLSE